MSNEYNDLKDLSNKIAYGSFVLEETKSAVSVATTVALLMGLISGLITSVNLLSVVHPDFTFLSHNIFVDTWNAASPDARLGSMTTMLVSIPAIAILKVIFRKK